MPKSVLISKVSLLLRATAALGVVLAFAPSAQASGIEEALKQVERNGQTRVIVRMKTERDGGKLSGPSWDGARSVSQQRAAVSRARGKLTQAMRDKRIAVRSEFDTLPFVGAVVNRQQLLDLATMPDVESIHTVQIERKQQLTNRPSLDTSVPSIDIAGAWAMGFDGEDYAVAVIDSGFDTSHAMLEGKAVGEACFATDEATFGITSQCGSGVSPQVGSGAASNCPVGSDRCDHGTFVASVAVGDDGVTSGVAPGANLVPIDVFSRYTSVGDCNPDPAPCELTDSEAVLRALDYVNQQAEILNIAAVNLSVGGATRDSYCDNDPRKPVIDMLRAKGVAVVVAAGNGGLTGSVYAPACVSSAIAVGATTDGVSVPDFTNFAPMLDVMAPGIDVQGALVGGGLKAAMGTSVAAPHVAGAWAVLRQAMPDATFDEIETAVKRTGVETTRVGAGFSVPKIRVARAILRLQGRDRQNFSTVLASSAANIGLAYLRFHNDSDTDGTVDVTLRDSGTGEELGVWTSPVIPAHGATQFAVSEVEAEVPGVVAAGRAYYNLDIESTFAGYMQHVQWSPQLGVLTNMSACGGGYAADARSISTIHTTRNADYPSHLRITNTGATENTADLMFYSASSGRPIGTWTSPEIAPGASLDVSMADIESEAPDVAMNVEADLWNVNVTLGNLSGYIQHVVLNNRSGVVVDMTAKCDLGLRAD